MAKSPMAEANGISTLLNAVIPAAERFPVDVRALALEYSQKRFPSDPITQIDAEPIPGFEGLLARHPSGKRWKICYNDQLQPPGRVRFTLAHEFGHYMLHRERQDRFECSEKDMHDWDSPDRRQEAEADTFASYLLMPLDDFRQQIGTEPISIELLRHCSDRYGVSLMAAALKCIEIAPKRAVVVAVRDGFALWARSNKAALKSGVYLATRKQLIEVPVASALHNATIVEMGQTFTQPARLWFPKEPADMQLIEHVHVSSGHYAYTLGLLLLPDAVPRWEQPEDELQEPLDGMLKFGH